MRVEVFHSHELNDERPSTDSAAESQFNYWSLCHKTACHWRSVGNAMRLGT